MIDKTATKKTTRDKITKAGNAKTTQNRCHKNSAKRRIEQISNWKSVTGKIKNMVEYRKLRRRNLIVVQRIKLTGSEMIWTRLETIKLLQ